MNLCISSNMNVDLKYMFEHGYRLWIDFVPVGSSGILKDNDTLPVFLEFLIFKYLAWR